MFQKTINALLFLSVVIFLFIFKPLQAHSQTYLSNSPYSRLGIGNLYPSQFVINKALGGISAGYSAPNSLNYNNPASYAGLNQTTFETGIFGNLLWLKNIDTTHQTGTASLAYIALGFPINKHWGSSIGLMPYNSVNYAVLQTFQNPIINPDTLNTQKYIFEGEGQWYKVYWGNGFKYKNFSAGFNIAYLFGTLKNQTITQFIDIDNSQSLKRSESLVAKDFIWNVGLQYQQPLSKDLSLSVGLNGNLPINITTQQDILWTNGAQLTTGTVISDTVYASERTQKNIKLPASYSLGATLNKGKNWMLGSDITFQQWSNFEKFGIKDTASTNSIRYAVGFAFTPDPRAFAKTWKGATYRLGFYYDTGNLQLNNHKINELAFTTGIGLPVPRINSRLNLTLEVGKRGTTAYNLIRENFVKATLGFTFNDKWFTKPKFD